MCHVLCTCGARQPFRVALRVQALQVGAPGCPAVLAARGAVTGWICRPPPWLGSRFCPYWGTTPGTDPYYRAQSQSKGICLVLSPARLGYIWGVEGGNLRSTAIRDSKWAHLDSVGAAGLACVATKLAACCAAGLFTACCNSDRTCIDLRERKRAQVR